MSDSPSRQPLPASAAPVNPGGSRAAFARAIADAAPAFLTRQRWFGDKTRTIAAVRLIDAAHAEIDGLPLVLAIVAVDFADGAAAHYFLPLARTDEDVPPAQVLSTGGERVVDALALPAVRDWLLACLAGDKTLGGERGRFVFRGGTDLTGYLPAARGGESRVGTAEQSNSALIFGATLLLKIFRKLQIGRNPDIEIGRFLTEVASFRHIPPLLGDLTYQTAGGEEAEISLAMAQPFVPNQGDGWSVLLDRLAAAIPAGDATVAIPLLRHLGQRTGQLHVALATPTDDPAFAPEPITNADADRWFAAHQTAWERTIAALQARAEAIPDRFRPRLASLTADDPGLAARRAGVRAVVGARKTRVHGDYHLGQVLVTPDEDVVIIDFEGEPARSLAERRAKTSPLVDVAGMLRSFAYARAAARRRLPPETDRGGAEATLAAWEQTARDAFLAGYRAETIERGVDFLPASPAAFAAAVAAWELDKAVYEVNYELNNRPDWLELPLETLLADPASAQSAR